jgi:CNT family concentrative nucleoside transporter
MNAAANIFIGQTEAPLVVKPYLRGLTEPQFYAVMVSGVSSIAGTVLAGYVMMGADIQYLLAAAFMAAPGGLLMAKIIMPDEKYVPPSGHEKLKMEPSHHGNVILAAAAGTGEGLRLAVNIGAMLVAFVALIALFNGLVGGLCGLLGIDTLLGVDEVTLQLILGKVFQPLMYLLSVPWAEAEAAGALFGEKLILNEFVAFSHFNDGGYDDFLVRICEPVVDRDTAGWPGCPRSREARGNRAVRTQGRARGILVEPDECRPRRDHADFLTS